MKIVLCGSMVHAKKILAVGGILRTMGHEVFLPEILTHHATLSQEQAHNESGKKMEKDIIRGYYDEISKGDALLVINEPRHDIPGYIGGNTLIEMAFAYALSKPIYMTNPIPRMTYTDEILAMKPLVINGKFELIRQDAPLAP